MIELAKFDRELLGSFGAPFPLASWWHPKIARRKK